MKSASTCLIPALCLALLLAFVPDANGTDYDWSGNGDANNGGNWSDQANWDSGDGTPGDDGYPDGADDNADLTASLSSDRYITNDVAVTVGTVTMEAHTRHHLVLGANMTIDTITGAHDVYKSHIDLNGYTLTLGQQTGNYMAALDGPGTFVKVSTGTVTLQGEDEYTGTMIVSNGLLQFRAYAWDTTTLMTVIDGATALLLEPGPSFPTNIAINGYGYSTGYGALHFSGVSDSCASDITVASDSKMTRGAGYATTLTGDIRGSGVLSLEGPGIWILGGTDVTYTNKLIITNGTTQLSGNFPELKHVLVDAGGVFEALQTQMPNATVVEQNGGVWVQPTSALWTGNGDPNNGGNWSDTANWSPPVVPTNQADLQATLSTARYITNDVGGTVNTIVMEDHGNCYLVLGANLTVNTIDGAHDKYLAHIDLNGYTFTLGQTLGPGAYTPALDGPGKFVKVSTGTSVLNGEDEYTGTIVVSNGLLTFRTYAWDTTTLLTVIDGATASLSEPAPSFPTNIVINGNGYNSGGALQFNSTSDDCASDIAVATDSKIQRDANTTTLTGDISGPGDLTCASTSTGTFDLDGTYNFAISGADGNRIIADSGDVNISGATISVSGEASATESEYVVIDFSGAGTVTGEFGDTNDLAAGWGIDYDGTDDNPDCVVAERPPPGVVILVR